MRKHWEINSSHSLDESIKIAFKQIQKFMEKRQLKPIKLLRWVEDEIELQITLLFEPGQPVEIRQWINEHRTS